MLDGFPDQLAAQAVTAPEELDVLGRRLAAADRAVVIAGSLNARARRGLWKAFVVDWTRLRSRTQPAGDVI